MALPTIASYALPTDDEVPVSKATWRPAAARLALLVHDMQGYFVRAFPGGQSPITEAMANIAWLRRCCHERGIPVFYSAQPGRQDPRDRGLQSVLWGPGMDSDPADQGIVSELSPLPQDIVLTKWRYSAFQRTDLEAQLRARSRDQLIVTGIFAHIGCMLTTADAFMRDIEPFFVADAVADFSRERHDQAVEYTASRCAVATSTARLLNDLQDTNGDRIQS